MTNNQADFLIDFRNAFYEISDVDPGWKGGQSVTICGHLPHDVSLRRNGMCHPGERFELGDLWCELQGHRITVEYESAGISVHNLLKYWPYVKGEMKEQPTAPVLICHFSDWGSYGSHRDLWNWLMFNMSQDQGVVVPIVGKQFDNGHHDVSRRQQNIQDAINWILKEAKVKEPLAFAADFGVPVTNYG